MYKITNINLIYTNFAIMCINLNINIAYLACNYSILNNIFLQFSQSKHIDSLHHYMYQIT